MRSRSSLLLLSLAVLALAIAAAPAALADGDPASDYLISQSTFLPPDGNIQKAEAERLVALLADAKKQGFPLKVAVITNRYDLGAVPILFGKPQVYAKFLGEEDVYYWKDELLVVMPNGFGIHKASGLPAADRALVASLPLPSARDGNSLVIAAEDAVRKLASKHGLTLSDTAVPGTGRGGGSSDTRDRILIGAGAGVLVLAGLGLELLRRRRRRKPS